MTTPDSNEVNGRPTNFHEPDTIAAANPFTASVEQRLAQAKVELEAVKAGVAKAEADLRSASVTVRSTNRAVEATVGPQGELTGLKFLDGKYRTMAAAELAATIVESTARARDTMSRRVMETFKPFTQSSSPEAELKGYEIDWEKIFGPSILDDPDTSAARAAQARLRDEINDESED